MTSTGTGATNDAPAGTTTRVVSVRRRRSDRGSSEILGLEIQGLCFTAGVSLADGEIAIIFMANNKVGSAAGIIASDAAMAASLALQHGCPLEVLREAMRRDSHGRASGPLGAVLDKIANARHRRERRARLMRGRDGRRNKREVRHENRARDI
jgi:ribonucleoside-diphosphate reductase alpha chain